MGIAGGITAISEIPTMFLFSYYIKKIPSDKLLKISGIFFVLKALGTYLANGFIMIYVAQSLQMFGFALFAVSSVYYVNERMEEKDRVKGQAYMTMTNSIGAAVGSLMGGVMIDKINVHNMLLLATLLGMLGAVGIFFFAEDRGKIRSEITIH